MRGVTVFSPDIYSTVESKQGDLHTELTADKRLTERKRQLGGLAQKAAFTVLLCLPAWPELTVRWQRSLAPPALLKAPIQDCKAQRDWEVPSPTVGILASG